MDEIIQVKDRYYIKAASCLVDDRTRVLKQGETFAVFDCRGDIQPIGRGEQGLYHEGTRFLSHLEFLLGNQRPLLLSSTVNEHNELLVVDLTNPDLVLDDGTELPRGSLHIFRSKFLWQHRCFERIRISHFGSGHLTLRLLFRFSNDFRDIFEVRGLRREKRGRPLKERIDRGTVSLPYAGLDGVQRQTMIRFMPDPVALSGDAAELLLSIAPGEERNIYLTFCCLIGPEPSVSGRYDDEFGASLTRLEAYRAQHCEVKTSKGHFNEWIDRSLDDLHMLFTDMPQGIYPYAGVPWYSTAFGRDGLITALQTLWINPAIARGVLGFLAANQAGEHCPETDAEPGKILHETRLGEMAALKEIPFGRYYGSIDSTPLFLMLAGAYFRRTGDRVFLEQLWPHILRALDWIDRHGDRDGDGYVEYQRQSENGLDQQGWKDSWDSVFHADGSPARGPIALCEVQGYVYAARRHVAELAEIMGDAKLAGRQREEAERLRTNFQRDFWCEDLSCYALALDGDKRPCRVASSNAGQCLFTGIAAPEHAGRMADLFLSPVFFSGWGVRTLAEGTAHYNPMAYHNGSVWPHDNALLALGLARYGRTRQAMQLFEGLYHLAMRVELSRLPELFCGFRRLPGQGPVLYPQACSPQAWAAGAVFQLLQASLGLSIDALQREIRFRHPVLPSFFDEMTFRNLRVAEADIDLHLIRYGDDVGITVLRREGDIGVVVEK